MYEDKDLQEIHEDIIELNEDISTLRRDLNNISASVNGTGENVTLNRTAEARFKKPPLPMGNSEQGSTTGKQMIDTLPIASRTGFTMINNNKGIIVDMSADNDMYFLIKENFESITTKAYTIAFEVSGIASGEQPRYTLWC